MQAASAATAVSGPPAAATRMPRSAVSCMMNPDRTADIGTAVVGVVSAVHVDVGDSVAEGQLLVSMRQDVEQAGVRAADARARLEADERSAAANLNLSSQRLERSIELEKEGFVTPQANDQVRTEQEVARQRLEQARGQRNVAQRELDIVRAQRGQRQFKSPFAGVVVERFANVAERVEDKPMLRVAVLDPLRVDLVVPASRWGSVSVQDKIDVHPELPGMKAVSATVSRIDRVIDGASNTFRVRLSLPNPNQTLPAGARCRVQWPSDPAPRPLG
jgi:membrane fusion protein, heavy metal efflux system